MKFISTAVAATKLFAKAHAPTIMVTAGVVSMGASVVSASKKTLYVESILKPHVEDLENVKMAEDLNVAGYTEKQAARDRGAVYGRVTVQMGRHYFVPGVLFVGGACLVFGGHRIMLKRNATLAIAFTSVSKAFEAYRANAVKAKGLDFDQAMLNGYTTKEVIDSETNEVYSITTRDWDADEVDPYNRVFEEGATSQWQPDLGVNKMFISQVQRMANIRLGIQGHLYLSDVYEALGFPVNDISRVVGWKAKKLPDGSRDIPFVDFGLEKPLPDDWKYGQNAAVYLDINCQGLIVGGKIQKILERA